MGHVAAALYAVEDYEVKSVSVTDRPPVWVRGNTACEEVDKIDKLPVIRAKYVIVVSSNKCFL